MPKEIKHLNVFIWEKDGQTCGENGNLRQEIEIINFYHWSTLVKFRSLQEWTHQPDQDG